MNTAANKLKCAALLTLSLLAFCGCAYGPTPADTLMKFESAYNEADFNTMLDCYDPTVSEGVKAGLDLVGGLVDINLTDIVTMMPLLADVAQSQGGVADMPQMSINVVDTAVSGSTATISTEVSITTGGQPQVTAMTFSMIKADGMWYIKDVQ